MRSRIVVALSCAALLVSVSQVALARSLAPPLMGRDIDYYGRWHDNGEIILHISNMGFVGDFGGLDSPSAEWPPGSGYEHLYVAGLWVGAVVGADSLVSTADYSIEFRPKLEDPVFRIYSGSAYAPQGFRLHDDDGDAEIDEERHDGLDDDGDGLIDEDYGGISGEMHSRTYFDTVDFGGGHPEDPHIPIGIEVHEETFAWSKDDRDDFVGLRYHITNISGATLDEVFVGILADPDIGEASSGVYYRDDVAEYVETVGEPGLEGHYPSVAMKLVYGFDSPGGYDGNWDGYIGFILLGHPTDPSGATAPPFVAPRCVRIWELNAANPTEPQNDPGRYAFMGDPGVFLEGTGSGDYAALISAGPFRDIQDGETLMLDFAIACGTGLEGLVEHAATAATIYNGYYNKKLGQHVNWALPDDYIPTSGQSTVGSPSLANGRGEAETYSSLYLAPPTPNPSRGICHLGFSIPGKTDVELAVFDPAGRRVATVVEGMLPPGMHQATWDGHTDKGDPAAGGVYFVRLRAAGSEIASKVVLVR